MQDSTIHARFNYSFQFINSFEPSMEGGMGVHGIAVLSFCFKRYVGIFDFDVRYSGII